MEAIVTFRHEYYDNEPILKKAIFNYIKNRNEFENIKLKMNETSKIIANTQTLINQKQLDELKHNNYIKKQLNIHEVIFNIWNNRNILKDNDYGFYISDEDQAVIYENIIKQIRVEFKIDINNVDKEKLPLPIYKHAEQQLNEETVNQL